MPDLIISRRVFSAVTTGLVVSSATGRLEADDKPKSDLQKAAGPVETSFERDYPPPGFKPSWKNPQINRVLVQDFVIFAHSELDMVQKLLSREPALLNATIDWGHGDWESGLGGASHMGRRDIVLYLLDRGARIDIFCAVHDGSRGSYAVSVVPHARAQADRRKVSHGLFNLHFHAQVGGKEAEPVLDYPQSIKKYRAQG